METVITASDTKYIVQKESRLRMSSSGNIGSNDDKRSNKKFYFIVVIITFNQVFVDT